jgi:GH18 family chitinase
MKYAAAFAAICWFTSIGAAAADPARILTNHLGYEAFGPKRAVIQGSGGDRISSCAIRTSPAQLLAFEAQPGAASAVEGWRDWRFWTLDFTDLQQEGTYVIECRNESWTDGRTLRSSEFKVQRNTLERATLSNVIAYFKAQRATGAIDRADRQITFQDSTRAPIDAHGGWYDATGDYGIHFSQLDFTSYFNTQQVPLTVYSLGRTFELLETRGEADFNQLKRRLIDETTYGADFLVRMQREGRSFYETIDAPGPGKKPEDRRIGPAMTRFGLKKTKDDQSPDQRDGTYEVSYRSGGGFAIAGLAIAARLPLGGDFDKGTYLRAAETAFAFLEQNNEALLNDGVENIVDDFCALAAATELLRTTGKDVYRAAAQRRANSLLGRLVSSGDYKDYWRADDKDRPFFHPSDAGGPIVTLLSYYDLADQQSRSRIKEAVRRSLSFELSVTNEVANPFGLARQYVQSKGRGRRSEFFFPHDTETAPWWQGENARLGSLATAARLAAPLFDDEPAFAAKLRGYATDQLNWILGLNPFDASMLHGSGRNNPEYGFFSSWQYTNFPGGIVNGVTSGFKDDSGIDFNLPYAMTHEDVDWRWGEQWLPHSSWYMLAVAANRTSAPRSPTAVIGYIFVEDKVIDPRNVPAEQLTHINYAFANIVDGVMVEGFKNDIRNFVRLNELKRRNPELKVLVSVGGWTWSGAFSDMALTAESRQRFIASAVVFLQRHRLDGLDIDWEYPGQKGLDNTHRPEDRQNFTALLAEMRAALDAAGAKLGKRYLLTIATGANDAWLTHTEMDKAQRSLDYVNLMAYDQFEETEPLTGHHAPLYTHPANPKQLSAALAVDHYVAAGVPVDKIVLGVPFYGRAWGEVSSAERGLYQPGKKPTVDLKTMYGDIAELSARDGFVRYWDEISAAPFLYNDARRLFISYDDPQSMRVKCRYVLDRGLAGVMFWELSSDPQHELLTALHDSCRR